MPTAAWNTFIELAPWLLLGAAVAGLLEALLPPGLLRRQLGGRGGVVRAVALGVPLPLCSCGVIPTGLGLKKQGASDGATIGFLISTPQTGVDSVLVTAALLGWPFALFKLVTAAATGLIGGGIANAIGATPARANPAPANPVPDNEEQTNGAEKSLADPPNFSIQPLPVIQETLPKRRWRDGLATADELLRSIWLWVLVGVVISAAITAALPTNAAGHYEGLESYSNLWGMLVALVISIPLYVCATASVPIAASLVGAGLPVGAAMVFLMAGPATNVATLGAVYRTLGGKLLTIYLTTILLGSIAGGLLFGWLIETNVAATLPPTHHHGESHPWWAIASAVMLALLFIRYAVETIKRKPHGDCCDHAIEETTKVS